MEEALEIEFKNMLTREEYQKLCQHFQLDKDQTWIQENYYFDTDDLALKKKGSAFRIRIRQDQAEITLKSPKGQDLLESNQDLDLGKAEEIIRQQSFPLSQSREWQDKFQSLGIDAESLNLLTGFKTRRFEKETKDGLIVLDHTLFGDSGDSEDFELEFEVAQRQAGQVAFQELLAKHQIPVRPADNKIGRALSYTENKL